MKETAKREKLKEKTTNETHSKKRRKKKETILRKTK